MIGSFSTSEMTAVVFGLLLATLMLFAGQFQPLALPASAAMVLGMVIWITLRDISDFIIPDGPLVCIALVGAAVRIALSSQGVVYEGAMVAVDAALCGGALLALREGYYRLRGIDGIGFGDVKLAGVGGILVGVFGFAWALFIASLAGLVVAIVATALKPQMKITRLPFGAFLAPVCWVLWVLGLMGVSS